MDAIASSIEEQILDFNQDLSRHELVIESPNPATQANLWLWADRLGLEFEYSDITKCATITRRQPISAQQDHQALNEEFHDFLDLDNTTTSQLDVDHTHLYDAMSSMDVDWDDVFSAQNLTDPNLSNHHDQMHFKGSAFPELESLDNTGASHLPDQISPCSLDVGNVLESTTQPSFTFEDLEMPKRQSFINYEDFSNSTSFQPVHKATDYTLGETFEKLGMQEYLDVFLQQGFDTWEAVLDITESDLDAMGVKLGHRRKLQREISNAKAASCRPSSHYIGHPTFQGSQDATIEEKSPLSERLHAVLKGTPCDDQAQSGRKNSPFTEDTEQGTDSVPYMLGAITPTVSRPSSMSSAASSKGKSRITKLFSRKRKTQEESYPGYQVWDSRSTNSASSSIGSGASGRSTTSTSRRGPLSGAARAMANAVKTVKACWRCKFMGKPCDVEPICPSCPKGRNGKSRSAWGQVGCKRGDLKDQMLEIILCPMALVALPSFNYNAGGYKQHADVNYSSQQARQKRQHSLIKILGVNELSLSPPLQNKPSRIGCLMHDEKERHPLAFRYVDMLDDLEFIVMKLESMDQAPEEGFCLVDERREPSRVAPTLEHETQQSLEDYFVFARRNLLQQKKHLEKKIAAIKQDCQSRGLLDADDEPAWELCRELAYLEEDEGSADDGWLGAQQDLKSVYLDLKSVCAENQSLIEILPCVAFVLWDFMECPRLRIVLSPMFISSYETLDTFRFFGSAAAYQGSVKDAMVRRGLKELVNDPDHWEWRTVQEYLIIAVRLFVATTGTYDPLMKNYFSLDRIPVSRTEEEIASEENFKAAQVALKQDTWNSNGIGNSMQYLQDLFEDRGDS